MSHDDHQLRTIIKLAIAAVPLQTRQRCAAERPKAAWHHHDAARAEMAERIAAEIQRHFDLIQKRFGRHLAPAPTGGLMPSPASGAPK